MGDVWELYSEVLLAAGRTGQALSAAKKVVELAPAAATLPLLGVANVCLRAGLPDEALENARLALQRGDGAAHETMARCYLAKGDLKRAARSAREALLVPRVHRRALLALAHIDVQRGDDHGALAWLDQIGPAGGGVGLAGVHYLRGDVLARQGLFDAAIREFEEEIRLFPAQTEARVGLALVLSSQSRIGDAKRTLADMVGQVGTAEAYDRAYRAFTFLGDPAAAEGVRREALARFPDDANLTAPGASSRPRARP
jgi:tetratricopeptide (TPR) repeat protein